MEKKEQPREEARIKTLSPGALTAKRFLRNRLAVAGLSVLAAMFLFSFVGGWLSPYAQDQVFYRDEAQQKEVAALRENTEFRYAVAEGQTFGAVLQAQFALHRESFIYQGVTYEVTREGQDLYSIFADGTAVAVAGMDVLQPVDTEAIPSFAFTYGALKAYAEGSSVFSADGNTYHLEDGAVYFQNREVAFVSRLVLQTTQGSMETDRAFQEAAIHAVQQGESGFTYGEDHYVLQYDAAARLWSVKQERTTRVYDAYAFPSKAHPLGTDKNGMDMLTRLMYGGRVSLVIGFIVVFISALLGVILGGLSGYFGSWADQLIMRLVDLFYCIPSTPLLIILGAAMDAMRLDPRIRMLYLMLILGFLGWPGIARLVRGQILFLREQEFMTATESSGLSIRRRIFRHLIPNVIPQLVVHCTMSLGATIITEATLSFLGLGVKFPFASWGNIMNDVSNVHVLTSYWFVWIPAGVCLMLAVLGFNFVGDGLRDAFDPRMKR